MSITIPPVSFPPSLVNGTCDAMLALLENKCPIASYLAKGFCCGDAALGGARA